MTAIAATMVAGSAFAHPVNEPHICGIDPDKVMDWPASNWVSEKGTIYDKGAYFFVATNDLVAGMSEYTTTHTRIWKDDCRVTGVDIFHADDDAAGSGTQYLSWDADTQTLYLTFGGETVSVAFDSSMYRFDGIDMAGGVAEVNNALSEYTEEELTSMLEEAVEDFDSNQVNINDAYDYLEENGVTIELVSGT